MPASAARSWRLVEQARIQELELDAVLLEHTRTRTRYLHLGCSDSNNAFRYRTYRVIIQGVLIKWIFKSTGKGRYEA